MKNCSEVFDIQCKETLNKLFELNHDQFMEMKSAGQEAAARQHLHKRMSMLFRFAPDAVTEVLQSSVHKWKRNYELTVIQEIQNILNKPKF